MKIIAFQIKNYRSIIDSRKCYLSPDYITALIGQNESGKTSVLEALRSFYEGNITDDVLRSDLTFPEIICTFKLDDGKHRFLHHIRGGAHRCSGGSLQLASPGCSGNYSHKDIPPRFALGSIYYYAQIRTGCQGKPKRKCGAFRRSTAFKPFIKFWDANRASP